MSKSEIKDLLTFLIPFPNHVKETTLLLREFVWDLYPDCNELIYDNYNALAIGFAPSDRAGDAFCSIAVYSSHVNFGFNKGAAIADPENKLAGGGNLYRSIKISRIEDLPKDYITKLLKEAYGNSIAQLKGRKQILKGATITKSISSKKRRPGIK